MLFRKVHLTIPTVRSKVEFFFLHVPHSVRNYLLGMLKFKLSDSENNLGKGQTVIVQHILQNINFHLQLDMKKLVNISWSPSVHFLFLQSLSLIKSAPFGRNLFFPAELVNVAGRYTACK